mgnify:CR=1 FL=1
MKTAREIYESGEMYLETILLLKKKNGEVHSVDVANQLHYAKSSVSRGIHILQKKALITLDDDGKIEFTAEGYEVAQKVYERHRILTECLKKLGVEKSVAEEDACRIEHVISNETFETLQQWLEQQERADSLK